MVSLEKRLVNEIRKDKYRSRLLVKAIADFVAYGDIDEFPMMFEEGVLQDEEQRVRAQVYSALIEILRRTLNEGR